MTELKNRFEFQSSVEAVRPKLPSTEDFGINTKSMQLSLANHAKARAAFIAAHRAFPYGKTMYSEAALHCTGDVTIRSWPQQAYIHMPGQGSSAIKKRWRCVRGRRIEVSLALWARLRGMSVTKTIQIYMRELNAPTQPRQTTEA
jgi:hypothetical protein